MKSLEMYEYTLKNSMDKDTMTLLRILLIDTDPKEIDKNLKEDKILAIETLNLQGRNNTTRNLCALITGYRIADIVALVEDHECIIEVPRHKKERVIGAVLHKVCEFVFFVFRIKVFFFFFLLLSNGRKSKIGLIP